MYTKTSSQVGKLRKESLKMLNKWGLTYIHTCRSYVVRALTEL